MTLRALNPDNQVVSVRTDAEGRLLTSGAGGGGGGSLSELSDNLSGPFDPDTNDYGEGAVPMWHTGDPEDPEGDPSGFFMQPVSVPSGNILEAGDLVEAPAANQLLKVNSGNFGVEFIPLGDVQRLALGNDNTGFGFVDLDNSGDIRLTINAMKTIFINADAASSIGDSNAKHCVALLQGTGGVSHTITWDSNWLAVGGNPGTTVIADGELWRLEVWCFGANQVLFQIDGPYTA